MAPDIDELMTYLSRPEAFPHPVNSLRVLETHISYVILTGEFAYKIRKNINLGFLDFSTLELRKKDCEEELRLNQRLAPELYLDVVPITGTFKNPTINGDGVTIEYAVKMQQFDPDQCLDHLISRQDLSSRHFSVLARSIANFHEHAANVDLNSSYGNEQNIWHFTQQNFQQIRTHITDLQVHTQLASLEKTSKALHQKLSDEFIQRRNECWVRECHGDLHLANLVLMDDTITPFDCLEFSAELRWIDTMSDIAFLVMDLIEHHQPLLAKAFLNHYLVYSGDYMGLSLLPYYLAYRAMVRAKVAAIRYAQQEEQPPDSLQEVQRYLNLAENFLEKPDTQKIVLMHGVSGSGKTWLAAQIAENSYAIHIRSDVERKRLLGLKPDNSTDPKNAYSPQLSNLTYQRLMALSYAIIDAGYSVIVDATFLNTDHRRAYERLAQVAGIELRIVSTIASPETLSARIQQRLNHGEDASEATIEVLNAQLKKETALTNEEKSISVTVDTSMPLNIPDLIQRLGIS